MHDQHFRTVWQINCAMAHITILLQTMTINYITQFTNECLMTHLKRNCYKVISMLMLMLKHTEALEDAESLLLSGDVRNVEMYAISPNLKYCFVQEIVNPAMSRTQEIYRVWVILQKEIASIQAGHFAFTIVVFSEHQLLYLIRQ